ncbi:MAG: AAA family ATPase [Sulfuriferula sp.]|nr:AAA family ATPase [Sulfuriferula sp.]
MKINVISTERTHANIIRQMLLEGNPQRQITLLDGGLELLTEGFDTNIPDLIIIDGICPGEEEFKTLEQLSLQQPGLAIVLLCKEPSSDFLLNMMRVGVKDVLPLPLVPAALQATVTRIEQKSTLTTSSRKHGKTIAFIACKGGSGATFIATNLAYILAADQISHVALLDLNLQFGDASLFISDQIPSNTLADVAENITRLDASFLTSSMLHVLPNLGVLASPEDPENAIEIKPKHVEALLNLAKIEYDYIVLDIGRALNATSVMALDHADMIFLVLQETLPFIRDAKRLLHALQALGYSKDKIHLIVNRYEKGGEIQLEDVERTLGMKVFRTIPNSYAAVSASVNQGIPIIKIAQRDPVTKCLLEIAYTMGNTVQPKNGGWFSHLLHH